jgi:hypothetical protein
MDAGPKGKGKTLYFRGAIIYGLTNVHTFNSFQKQNVPHYTVVFKCNDEWMFFDDMEPDNIIKVSLWAAE